MDKSEGVSRTSVEQFLSHRTEFFVGEAFCTSENFRYRIWLCIGTREYQKFPSKSFNLTEPKIYVEEAFCSSEKLQYRKFLWIRVGCIRNFGLKVFVSQFQKKFVGEPLYVSEKTRSQKKFGKKVGVVSQFFNGCFFVAQYLKSL